MSLSPSSAAGSAAAAVSVRDVSRSFGPRVVLDAVTFTIAPNARIGIVAPNGTGKSTLLRIIAGLDPPDTGVVARTPPTATIGYLPQEPDRRPEETLLAFLARRTGVAGAVARFEAATEALASGGEHADDEYSHALEAYLALGAPDFEARAASVTARVGLAPELLDLAMPAMSGGQAARASLAAILLSRFDVLLLDEPTNDLDFAGLELLEAFVRGLSGGVMIVSHDRAFLDRTITSVVELDEHSHRATVFAGGWSAYLEERATARRHAEEAYGEYQDKRSQLTARSQQQREWAVQGAAKVKKSGERDKFIRHFNTQASEQLAGKARITDRALERLDANAVDKPWEGWDLRMEVAAAPRSGDLVARLAGATVQLGTFVLGPVDVEVAWGERVAILGANGSGKTTLLRALLGDLPLRAGEHRLGPSVIVGRLDQARVRFASESTLLEAFQRETGQRETGLREAGADVSTCRSTLAKFGLGAEHVTRPTTTLSPGERTRAVLALFTLEGVNCLVLDEPTNHLDVPAIEQLEVALQSFGGTVLLVTHDRRLLEAVELSREVRIDAGRIVADVPR